MSAQVLEGLAGLLREKIHRAGCRDTISDDLWPIARRVCSWRRRGTGALFAEAMIAAGKYGDDDPC
ncbi:hypothetical protein BDV10DRAFT_127889 [Aspergillus recurvatus]